MISRLYLFFALLLPTIVNGQYLHVSITSKFGNDYLQSPIIPTGALRNTKSFKIKDNYKGFDTTKYVHWGIRTFSFYSAQTHRENAHSDEEFYTYAKSTGLDTSYIITRAIPKNKAAVFVGLTSDGLKHIIVDSNNDKDFSNDPVMIFDLNKEKRYPIVPVEFDYFDGKNIKSAKVPLVIDVYSNFVGASGTEEKLQVSFLRKAYKEGKIKLDGKQYIIQLSNDYFDLHEKGPYRINIRKTPLDSTDNNNYIFKNTDTLFIGQNVYVIDKLRKAEFLLRLVKKIKYDGAKINTLAQNFSSKDIIDGKTFSLYKEKGKYVLLDFWGSWCKPCIETLPELEKYYQLNKNKKIKFIGIAYDKPDDIGRLKEFIKQYNLVWQQLYFEIGRHDMISPIKMYQISNFPTTILIDPLGKVVMRESNSVTGLKKIFKYLEGKL